MQRSLGKRLCQVSHLSQCDPPSVGTSFYHQKVPLELFLSQSGTVIHPYLQTQKLSNRLASLSQFLSPPLSFLCNPGCNPSSSSITIIISTTLHMAVTSQKIYSMVSHIHILLMANQIHHCLITSPPTCTLPGLPILQMLYIVCPLPSPQAYHKLFPPVSLSSFLYISYSFLLLSSVSFFCSCCSSLQLLYTLHLEFFRSMIPSSE